MFILRGIHIPWLASLGGKSSKILVGRAFGTSSNCASTEDTNLEEQTLLPSHLELLTLSHLRGHSPNWCLDPKKRGSVSLNLLGKHIQNPSLQGGMF